ncbi:fungal chitosanase of glycosyl hydrolase group 75 family protein [Burkholderia pseudomallei MSHR5613]|nr:fungal chitosanase of glycosyl hydrolase group 75 family protein [Burkholderia pseudomallei MSHR5613]
MKQSLRIILDLAKVAGIVALGVFARTTGAAPAVTCPGPTTIGGLPGARFHDGSFGVKGPLAVNPDGAKASYTRGDHGFTYVSNGMDLFNPKASCQSRGSDCSKKFREAEARGFGQGTPEFCVYAIEVEPIPPKTATIDCGNGKKVIGNGKGRPRVGEDQLDTVDGGKTSYYVSMTRLNQLLGGKVRPIDSAMVPSIVVPTGEPNLVGRVVYVAYQGRDTLAVAGDTGPRFGEGSIALHEMLRYGGLQTPPKIGPISLSCRCGEEERALKPPFEARPDFRGDRCAQGVGQRGAADIRAYAGIDNGVTMVVLGKASLPMKSAVSQVPVTLDALREAADKAGYTDASLKAMASCLEQR